MKDTSGPRGTSAPREEGEEARRPARRRLDIERRRASDQALQAIEPARCAASTIYYPRKGTPAARFSRAAARLQDLRARGSKCYQSYRMVVSRDLIGEYYGLQGTTWMDPPILGARPSEKREYRGRDFELHYDGDRLRLVAWREKSAVYWVSNTLLQTLSASGRCSPHRPALAQALY